MKIIRKQNIIAAALFYVLKTMPQMRTGACSDLSAAGPAVTRVTASRCSSLIPGFNLSTYL